jgi:hypothetical protein
MILAGPGLSRLLAVGALTSLGLWLEGWIGVLLLVAAADLAASRRPFSARPLCWPALGITAVGLLLVDPTLAFVCGWLVEIACDPALTTTRTPGAPGPRAPGVPRPVAAVTGAKLVGGAVAARGADPL